MAIGDSWRGGPEDPEWDEHENTGQPDDSPRASHRRRFRGWPSGPTAWGALTHRCPPLLGAVVASVRGSSQVSAARLSPSADKVLMSHCQRRSTGFSLEPS